MKTDHQLKQDVIQALVDEPAVTETHVGVSVKGGVVTLVGHVHTYVEKLGAEKAARRVEGVRAIANELDVEIASHTGRTDEDIAAGCVNALRSHLAVPDDRIEVIVSNGWVKLEGTIDHPYQKPAAEEALRNEPGIRGITNGLTLRPPVSASAVKQAIVEAFRRSAELDAANVTVQTRDTTVILHGRVRSWAEKEQAHTVAWSASGVTDVQNDIVVSP